MQCRVKVYATFGESSTATSEAYSPGASENEDLKILRKLVWKTFNKFHLLLCLSLT